MSLLAALAALCIPGACAQDTASIYHDIERYAAKRGFTRWIHGTIFVEPRADEEPPAPGTPHRRDNPLIAYDGRIVRTVTVKVLDPFGHRVTDTTRTPTAWIQRAGNGLHRTTREYLVRELVLVKKNERFDHLEAAESERLLRRSPVVNDALVSVVPVHGGTDTVDVLVTVLDKWSIDGWIDISDETMRITGRERNLAGWAQELEQTFILDPNNELVRLEGRHEVYNIKGTYIRSLIDYSADELEDRVGFRLDRPFYSPLTRWAGAFGLSRAWTRVPVVDEAGAIRRYDHVDPFEIDTWLGHGFPLAATPTDPARSSAIVTGLRYTRTRYASRPAVDSTGTVAYPNSDRVIASAGLSVRQYYRDRYLYRFGAVEDVPEGLLFTATGGFRDREQGAPLAYTGVELSRGRHYHGFGYATAIAAYGTYWERSEPSDAVLTFEARYFSDLFQRGRWFLRQFVSLAATSITRKDPTEMLDINGDQLYGFESQRVVGTHKELLRFETVAYAPWNLVGFKFAPVLLVGFGTIGEAEDPLASGRIHSAFGLGILVRNENLLVKTFQISLNFYPFVPEEDGWVLDVNRYSDFTTRLNEFTFTQPDVVSY